jgi:hypothetical protein
MAGSINQLFYPESRNCRRTQGKQFSMVWDRIDIPAFCTDSSGIFGDNPRDRWESNHSPEYLKGPVDLEMVRWALQKAVANADNQVPSTAHKKCADLPRGLKSDTVDTQLRSFHHRRGLKTSMPRDDVISELKKWIATNLDC